MNEKYNKQFFEHQKNMSILSAKEVVPLIINILDPKSVVDLGCGTGTWSNRVDENPVKGELK